MSATTIDQLYWLEKDERLGKMCIRALDLDYTWDVSNYPTPAWYTSCSYVPHHDLPWYDIPKDVWNRELRLWACDCVERVVHVWEEWAKMHMPEHVNTPREAMKAVRAGDFLSCAEILCIDFNAATAVMHAAHAAYFAAYYNCSDLVVRHAAAAALDSHSERKWQIEALAKRIDNVAPWRIP